MSWELLWEHESLPWSERHACYGWSVDCNDDDDDDDDDDENDDDRKCEKQRDNMIYLYKYDSLDDLNMYHIITDSITSAHISSSWVWWMTNLLAVSIWTWKYGW